MKQYVGLDVSLKATHICVVDEAGAVASRASAATEPQALAAAIRRHAPHAVCVVLETGAQSSWLERGLRESGLEAVIIDARRAKAVLSCRPNKTDPNDAEGLAQLARSGWYHRIAAKRPEARHARALLLARSQLAKQRRDVENQIRALLRGFGLSVGAVSRHRFEARVAELLTAEPQLAGAVTPLLTVRRALLVHIRDLEARIREAAASAPAGRLLMSAPGVGPMTALAFITTLDDPHRFRRSAAVGAYVGLTPRRRQSGTMDVSGRISKWGDALVRHYLYEAANALITRVRRWSALKAWGTRLVKRIGPRKARVAVARKLAVVLHRMWVDGTAFAWSRQAVAA